MGPEGRETGKLGLESVGGGRQHPGPPFPRTKDLPRRGPIPPCVSLTQKPRSASECWPLSPGIGHLGAISSQNTTTLESSNLCLHPALHLPPPNLYQHPHPQPVPAPTLPFRTPPLSGPSERMTHIVERQPSPCPLPKSQGDVGLPPAGMLCSASALDGASPPQPFKTSLIFCPSPQDGALSPTQKTRGEIVIRGFARFLIPSLRSFPTQKLNRHLYVYVRQTRMSVPRTQK